VGQNRCKEIAVPIYMKIAKNGVPVIRGDATVKGHQGWIELSTVQMGLSRPPATDREQSEPSVSEIVVTKSMDSASPALFQQSLDGEAATIQIDFLKSGRDNSPYLTYTLQKAVISSYSTGIGRTDESVSLRFTKMTIDAHGTGPDVSAHAGLLMRGWNGSPDVRCIR
jgi:type VI secretion system secreted protein Hcp